ncbi:hypothetical protein EDD18DRAFT_1170780 [Armillaria luteobubalina]|uniref:Uncharacterized protein n=2 Tax=Armillaria luteobubalina TaxID=153913 RepID=A0AA39Q598_9AGAR|nr:hypothetical protein EDD18DRAFT_1170780 [Armillaria luteobubalina]
MLVSWPLSSFSYLLSSSGSKFLWCRMRNKRRLWLPMDLGTKLTPTEFMVRCFPRGDANWELEYPGDCLFPLMGTITDENRLLSNGLG